MDQKTEQKKILLEYYDQVRRVYSDEAVIEIMRKFLEKCTGLGLNLISYYFEGSIAYRLNSYSDAMKICEKSMNIDKKFPPTWILLGNIHYAQGRYDKALDAYDHSIDLDEQNASPWHGKGTIFNAQGNYEMALEAFNIAIKFDIENSKPWGGKGFAYYHLGEYEKSNDAFDKALLIDKEYPNGWFGKSCVLGKQGHYNRAFDAIEYAIELNKTSMDAWSQKGNIYKELGENNKAIETYETAILLNKKEAAVPWNQKAIVHLKLSENDKAMEAFKKALSLETQPYNKTIIEKNIKRLENNLKASEKTDKDDDRITKVLKQINQKGMARNASKNQKSFYSFLDEKPAVLKKLNIENCFSVLRRWNSYTPIIANNYHISKGGGYFIKVGGEGIVIDPGFNFIDNFKGAGHLFNEIDAVVVSHAHNDHTADLESILTLLHKYNEIIKGDPDNENSNDSIDGSKQRQDICNEIAQERNIDPNKVETKDIQEVFKKSKREKTIKIYMTLSTFKKYSGMFDLFSSAYYSVHIIEEGSNIKVCGIEMEVLKAKHYDIISDRNSVGFVFKIKGSVIVYTGDTGWNDTIESEYKRVKKKYKKVDLLIAHLGGFKSYELNYLNKDNTSKKTYYKNHLGRLGLVRINEVLQPEVCFISEFGEELKGHRIELAEIFNDAFESETVFFAADIGLSIDLKTKRIHAITSIDTAKYEYSKEFVDYKEVKARILRKDYSLHYYHEPKEPIFDVCDLVEILSEEFDQSTKGNGLKSEKSE